MFFAAMKVVCFSICLLVVFFFSSCHNKIPEDILSPSKMEEILYDYHIAQAMGQLSDSADYNTQLYSEAVFKKYDITEADFDKSMEYYSRHADELYKIYQKLNDRFGSSANPSKLGVGHPIAGADTTIVWSGNSFNLLSANGRNHLDFNIPLNSTVQAGSQLIMRFYTQWVYHEGEKSAILNLTIHYANDSTVVMTRNVYDSGEQTLSMWVGDVPIRSISGFVYQVATWATRPKLLVISQPMLLCVNPKREDKTQKEHRESKADSSESNKTKSSEQYIQDSLLNMDKEHSKQNHFK